MEGIVACLQDAVVTQRGAGEIARRDGALILQKDRIGELKKALEDSRRRHERPSAPFSKGDPKAGPGRAGLEAGQAHGRHGNRVVPPGPPDRDVVAPLPECCPDCGGEVCFDRDEEQWQVDVPDPKVNTTRFKMAIGHCAGCVRRLQGHPDQVSDALGAAGGADRAEREGLRCVAALRAGAQLRPGRSCAGPSRPAGEPGATA